MNRKHALTMKGLSALLLGVTVLASSCKKNDSPELSNNLLTEPGASIMATGTTSSGSLLFNAGFEETDAFSKWHSLEVPSSTSITRVTSPFKAGSYSAKVVLNKSDRDVSSSKRAEITYPTEVNPKAERWYGVSMHLPTSYIKDPCEEIVLQWHENPDFDLGESWRQPPIALFTVDGKWKLVVRNSPDAVNTNQTAKGGAPIDLGVYETGKWTDWVFHIKFSYQSDGLIEIWKNKQLVYTLNGPNNYNDKLGNYLKMGLYKFGWKDGYPTTTTQRTIYFDEFRIGNELSSYDEVAPRTNTTTPEPAPAPAPTPTPTPTPTPNVVFAVNAGGSSYTASNGITYAADKNFSGGTASKTTTSISNTPDDALYQSDRYGSAFNYSIPVTNGTYEITFRFAELLFTAAGKRQIDVLAEGRNIIDNLDIFSVAGRYSPYNVVKTVTVTDGNLNLNFNPVIGNAKVSAFHVIKK